MLANRCVSDHSLFRGIEIASDLECVKTHGFSDEIDIVQVLSDSPRVAPFCAVNGANIAEIPPDS